MKKLLFIIFIFYSLSSFSQKTYSGLKVGVNYSCSSQKSKVSLNKNYLIGFTGGGYIGYSFRKNISIQIEALYNTKGYAYRHMKYTNMNGSLMNNAQIIYKLNYLDVPILLKLSTGNKISSYFIIGVSPSFLLSGKNIFKNGPWGGTEVDMNGYVKSFNLGVTGGFGIELKKYKKLVPFIEARYYYGTNQIFKQREPHFAGIVFIYINSINIMGGLTF